MILIVTHKSDYTADYLINILNKRKIEYRRLNCEDILQIDCKIQLGTGQHFSLLGCDRIHAVWFRRTKLPDLGSLSMSQRLYVLHETEGLIGNLFEIIDAHWLSLPNAVYRAENKLLQLKMARQLGFTIPDTLVSNSKHDVTTFFSEHNSTIVKPLAQTRLDEQGHAHFIFTSAVSANHIQTLDEYDLTPCIFQEEIEKDYEIRVTVVGTKAFSAAVYSQDDEETRIDWRRKKLKFERATIPPELEAKCISLVDHLGLQFGAIDIIKGKDGRYVFLEINPNGQWVWIEMDTGLPISEAIIENLLQR